MAMLGEIQAASPHEDVAIPLNELPEPERDNGGSTESTEEQEMKWTDLASQSLRENIAPTGNGHVAPFSWTD